MFSYGFCPFCGTQTTSLPEYAEFSAQPQKLSEQMCRHVVKCALAVANSNQWDLSDLLPKQNYTIQFKFMNGLELNGEFNSQSDTFKTLFDYVSLKTQLAPQGLQFRRNASWLQGDMNTKLDQLLLSNAANTCGTNDGKVAKKIVLSVAVRSL